MRCNVYLTMYLQTDNRVFHTLSQLLRTYVDILVRRAGRIETKLRVKRAMGWLRKW